MKFICISPKMLVWLMLLICTQAASVWAEEDAARKCAVVLDSTCNLSQEEMLEELLQDMEFFGTFEKIGGSDDQLIPAFEVMPKDHLGMINWNKAVTDGIIRPRGTLTDEETEAPYEGFLDNIIFFQAKVFMMADVAFPHGIHSYWLSCDSCHPKPFKKKIGGNIFTMQEIFEGKWCGKCHGKVAFPASGYANCRRCHVITKRNVLGTGHDDGGGI